VRDFRRRGLSVIAFAVCFVASGAADARVFKAEQMQDSRVGKWRLVQMKIGSEEPPPTSSVWTYTIDGSELRVDAHSIGPTGRAVHWFFKTKLDGTEARVRGNPSVDHVVMTRRDEGTLEIVYKKGGAVTTVGTNEISADGQTMTVTLKDLVGTVTIGVYKKLS
jgi:hypothetical protein